MAMSSLIKHGNLQRCINHYLSPPGCGSATRVLLLHSARFSAPPTVHTELQVHHVTSIIISLFKYVLQKRYEVRTDGEVAAFVRESASLVTGKTDKMDTDHEASSAWTDLARWQKKDPEIGPIVRLQTEYEREAVIIIRTSWVGVKWLRNRWDQLEVGYVRNGLLYLWFISNSCNEEHVQCY